MGWIFGTKLRAEGEEILTVEGVVLDRLVEVVGDGGSVRLNKEVPLAADEGIVEAADDPLDYGLDVPAEAPQPRREIPTVETLTFRSSCIFGMRKYDINIRQNMSNLRFGKLRRRLQYLLEKLGIGAEKERFGWRIVDVEDLDQEAENDGHQRQDVHLACFLSSSSLRTSVPLWRD